MATKKAASAKKTAKDVVKKAVAAVKKSVAKATTPAPKKAAAKAAPAPAKKAAATKAARPAKQAASSAKTTATKKAATATKPAATKTSTTKQPAKKVVEVPKKAAATKAGAHEPATKPVKKAASHGHGHPETDTKFLEEQRALLLEEREQYVNQAAALKAEADQLAAEAEGESEFTEEGGDVDSMSAERERDLALASQARQNIEEIDRALAKIDQGTYGLCERCGQPIVKARLRALPYAALCVACKSGGLSARR